jgi:hypothetical protein
MFLSTFVRNEFLFETTFVRNDFVRNDYGCVRKFRNLLRKL